MLGGWTKGIVVAALFSAGALPAWAAVTIKNTSSYMGGGRWEWMIYVDADPDTLKQIQCVQYTLHPTFPNPIRKVCGHPETKFGLSTNGWGTFVIGVEVRYRDGRLETMQHQLVFEQTRASAPPRMSARNWSRQIEPGWWEWGLFIDGTPEQLKQIRCVEYTLHSTFPNPVRLVCSRSDKFLLTARGWGTFMVPVKLILEDGSINQLRHQLVFQ